MHETPPTIAICTVHGDWWTPEDESESCPNLGCRAEVDVYIYEHSYVPDGAAPPREQRDD
jgi:hypothetical protein